MKSLRNGIAGACALVVVVSASALVQPAAAATTLSCGQTVTHSVTLGADVGPCSGGGDGIVVGADNITIDLAGHRVIRTGPPADDVGVHLRARTGVTVKGGTVSGFGTGVAIEGGSHNTVSAMKVHDNIGVLDGSGNYGDGVGIFGSSYNRVLDTTAAHNGPFEGIGVFGNNKSGQANVSYGNQILDSTVKDNTIIRTLAGVPDFFLTLDDGINLGQGLAGASHTTMVNNVITANGLNGIDMCSIRGNPCFTDYNVVQSNVVKDNGFTNLSTPDGHETGRGINVDSITNGENYYPQTHDLIADNVITGNASTGLFLVSKANQVLRNSVVGNGVAHAAGAFDDVDFEFAIPAPRQDCTALGLNVIRNNVFGTVALTVPLACILHDNTVLSPPPSNPAIAIKPGAASSQALPAPPIGPRGDPGP